MQNIIKVIRIAKPLYFVGSMLALLIVLGALLELITPIISKYIVDDVVMHLQHKTNNLNSITFLIVLTFVIGVVNIIFTTIADRLGDYFAGRLRKFLTELFYDKILTLPQSYFDSEISGKIINQLNRGIFTVQQFMNTATNFIMPTILQTIFTIVLLGYYNLAIAALAFLLFPIYFALSYYSTKKWGKDEEKKNKIEDRLRGRMSEVVNNIKLVKSFTNEKKEYQFVSDELKDSNVIYDKQSTTFHLIDFLRNISLTVIITIITIIAFFNTYNGLLSVGSLVLIIQLIGQLMRPLFSMSFILTQIQTTETGSKEFFSILDLPSKENYMHTHIIDILEQPSIQFKKVHFQYETSEEVLNSVSFMLDKKEKVALVGHSGAGKSTIVNLILKLYDPTKGDIFIGDMNYKELDHGSIRKHIALVFQENELFSETIKENVMYGMQASDQEVENALQLAHAWEFVEKLPKGIYSEVGERGVRLSGGQKQRIQIARAILKNAPILILDEATSSLDAKSEHEVQDGLENLMKNKLVLIIAHRFSTIQNVQKIIVIDNGKIVENGSPKALSEKPGVYYDLLQYQIEGNKKLLANFDIY